MRMRASVLQPHSSPMEECKDNSNHLPIPTPTRPSTASARPSLFPTTSLPPPSHLRPSTAPSPSHVRPPSLQRSILLTRTSRRVYTASPHRIPFNPSPFPLPPTPAPFHSSPPPPPPSLGPFFLSSDTNRSDSFLAAMKAMSNNFSSYAPPPLPPPPIKGPCIARQFAFTATGHRKEMNLIAQLGEASRAYPSSSSVLPLSSSLSTKGGYLPHAPHSRGKAVLQEGGEGRAVSYRPSYWDSVAFVPVWVRGPALPFGSGREAVDEVKEAKRRIKATQQREKDRAKARQRQRGHEEKEGEGFDEEERDYVKANMTELAAVSTRRSRLSEALHQKHVQAREVRERLKCEEEERHHQWLYRHTPEYRVQREREEAALERRQVLQRSWLLVLAVSIRTQWFKDQVEHYQGVMRIERAVKVIVSWLRRCQNRRRQRRFLHARRQLRLFFEERAMISALRADEGKKRQQLDLVLSFLQGTLNRRQNTVVTAFGGLERKAVVIQRAWRGFLVTNKWRLYCQILQFLAFEQPSEAYDLPPDTTPRPPTAPPRGRPPMAKLRIRYLRFHSPFLRSGGPVSESTSCSRFSAMLRMQREVMRERLLEEAKIYRVIGERRRMDDIRNHISRSDDGLASPRSVTLSTQSQVTGPTVCGVEWEGVMRVRRVMLTSRQLHELHRRAVRVCGVAMGVGSCTLEKVGVVGVGGRYVRRAVVVEGEEIEGGSRRNCQDGGERRPGFVSYAQMKRWNRHPIMNESSTH